MNIRHISSCFFIYFTLMLSFFVLPAHARERHYYIAAEEVDWDYAPEEQDLMMGHPLKDDQKIFVETGPDRLGKVYKKARFFSYEDESFTKKIPTPPEWKHKEILGPILRGEVGDTLIITFKNKTSRPYSLHPHGVFYKKDSEGSATNDGTKGQDKADDKVAPGQQYIYTWQVSERAGPGPADPSSVVWPYHSHVDEIADTNAGLIGAILITKAGMADEQGRPKDVDREFVTLFKVFDENASPYLDNNISLARTREQNEGSWDQEDEAFVESNLLHAINGRLFGNWTMPEMHVGERVRWYVIGFGNEVDMHSTHWHGSTVLHKGSRLDTAVVFPSTTVTVDMRPDSPGIWMFHCHVDDHLKAGMTGRYHILPAKKPQDL